MPLSPVPARWPLLALAAALLARRTRCAEKTGVRRATVAGATHAPPPRPRPPATGADGGGGHRRSTASNIPIPAQVAAIPQLAARLEADARKAQGSDDRRGRGMRRPTPRPTDFPYNPHSYEREWKVVADLPGWLSLSDDFCHLQRRRARQCTVWKRWCGTRRTSAAFDADRTVRLARCARARRWAMRLCAALNAEREKRRGEPVDPAATTIFDDCARRRRGDRSWSARRTAGRSTGSPCGSGPMSPALMPKEPTRSTCR